MYDCILFDFDGTLFDTVEGISRSVRYALNKVGIDAELESLRCFAGPPPSRPRRISGSGISPSACMSAGFSRE